MAEIVGVTTRDKSSGRYHVRYVVDGRSMVDERCNLDSAGAYDLVEGLVVEETDPELLCGWCFPVPTDEEVGE